MVHQHETNSADAELLPIDLRSDTVTKPTEAMYARMASAPIGDDGLDGDPTVRELEAVAAAAMGKDAGLFVPSCTMANLLAALAQSQRSEQIVLESTAHMYTSERGAATFTGQFYLAVAGTAGAMDLNLLQDALQGDGLKLRTALVAMETSHNNASGAVLSLEHMQAVHAMASARGVPVHLDGARLFNAAIALEVAPAQIAKHCDTVSLCLSKGLSAPAGAVLAGPHAVIDRSRRFRRMLGGTQRQIGILAAAGLEAIQVMGARLAEDHRRARTLSDALNEMHPKVSATIPQTNIVQVDLSLSGRDSAAWSGALESAGLRTRPWGRHRLRCVTHRHIDDADIERAVMAFRSVAAGLA
ncbi:low specificity L-threonine aldolase [Bradyrhizobium sp. WSM3983]|uniref:threonine aldolase family protein n=1 Tax=Bradyrhizobium sp. WSM3983 TaxID=1038867 RepID=UPI0004078E8C|nr:GntG family PLP-dependent aldolase [Bradyrhizobium sp. WSM3983]